LNTTNIVRVVSTQSVSSTATSYILSWLKSVGGTADVLGITGYFDCGGLGSSSNSGHSALLNVSQVFSACYNDIPNIVKSSLNMIKMAAQYNLSVQTYEGS
jgi:hypothetical protein